MEKLDIDNVLKKIDWKELHNEIISNDFKNKKIVIHKDGTYKLIFADMPLESYDDYIIGVLKYETKENKEYETLLYESWKNQIKEQYSTVIKYLNMTNL